MEAFVTEGGYQLSGTVKPQGAKDEALQVICATFSISNPVTIKNIPDVLGVNNLIRSIREIGIKVTRIDKDDYAFQAGEVNLGYLDNDAFISRCPSSRDSVLTIGPLLGRSGRSTIAKPGGDKVGHRRLDAHFLGFKALDVKFRHDMTRDVYHVETANKLKGCYMLLDEASATGTVDIIMAVVMVGETTIVYNAACEPYIQQLCHLLSAMGASVSNIASNLLTIVGVRPLYEAKHTVLPDMIEMGPFIGMTAMVGNGVGIKDVAVQHLGIVPDTSRRLGIKIKIEGNDLLIPRQPHYRIDSFIDGAIIILSDVPWLGLTPDLLSVLLMVATQACGCMLFHQRMFESRLFFVDKLIDMHAQVILCDPHRAVVIGHDRQFRLRISRMTGLNIRAGIALLIATLSAEGTSRIENIAQIDRGYENIEVRLNALGAHIKRVDD